MHHIYKHFHIHLSLAIAFVLSAVGYVAADVGTTVSTSLDDTDTVFEETPSQYIAHTCYTAPRELHESLRNQLQEQEVFLFPGCGGVI